MLAKILSNAGKCAANNPNSLQVSTQITILICHWQLKYYDQWRQYCLLIIIYVLIVVDGKRKRFDFGGFYIEFKLNFLWLLPDAGSLVVPSSD